MGGAPPKPPVLVGYKRKRRGEAGAAPGSHLHRQHLQAEGPCAGSGGSRGAQGGEQEESRKRLGKGRGSGYPHVLAVGGPHGRFEHLLAHRAVKIILVEARRGRRGPLGHGNTYGPLRQDRGRRTSPALAGRGEPGPASLPGGAAGGTRADGWGHRRRVGSGPSCGGAAERARPALRPPPLAAPPARPRQPPPRALPGPARGGGTRQLRPRSRRHSGGQGRGRRFHGDRLPARRGRYDTAPAPPCP